MSTKLEKLQQLIQIANDGLSREEFLESFQKIMSQILSIEVKVLERVNKAINETKNLQEVLKTDTEADLEVIKNRLLKEVEKMFEDQRNGMNFIHDKVRRIKEGVDGVDGAPGPAGRDGRDGKDADPKAIIAEVLNKLQIPDYEGDIKALKEEIEELKRMRRLGGGGGFSKIHMERKMIDDEVPSGTIDGSNATFTLAHIPNPETSVKVYVNGQRMKAGGVDYTLSSKTITFVTAPPTTSILLVDYRI